MSRLIRHTEPAEKYTLGDWPAIEEMKSAQKSPATLKPINTRRKYGTIIFNELIWIPFNVHNIQLKIILLSHCGVSGHGVQTATVNIAKEMYQWKKMSKDCRKVLRHFHHCITSSSSERILRPLSSMIHASRPN